MMTAVLFPVDQNQHDDLKKQYYELQDQHQVQGEDHSRLLDEHKGRYEKLQQVKEVEIGQLKGTDGLSPTQTDTHTFCYILYFNTTQLHTDFVQMQYSVLKS